VPPKGDWIAVGKEEEHFGAAKEDERAGKVDAAHWSSRETGMVCLVIETCVGVVDWANGDESPRREAVTADAGSGPSLDTDHVYCYGNGRDDELDQCMVVDEVADLQQREEEGDCEEVNPVFRCDSRETCHVRPRVRLVAQSRPFALPDLVQVEVAVLQAGSRLGAMV